MRMSLLSMLGVLGSAVALGAQSPPPRLTALVIVVDGLRPDHVTPSLTPSLHRLASRGVVSSAHHSIYPTVTRVNAASLATGALPRHHGILDNVIYLPEVDSLRPLNTADAAEMQRADSVLAGRLITTTTVHERLARAGLRSLVVSSGSSGSAYILAGAGQVPVLNPDFVHPRTLAPALARRLGAAHASAREKNRWAVRALLEVGIDSLDVDVAYLWLTDPDNTVHGAGLGTPVADSVVRAVDAEIGGVLDGLARRGLDARTNVIVVSDHGFSTHAGPEAPFRQVLSKYRGDLLIAGSSVYLKASARHRWPEVLGALGASKEVGSVFTPLDARLQSLDAVFGDHPRSGDIVYSAQWSHDRNRAGIPGWTAQAGVAGHGTTSPWDIAATFVAAGPAFRSGVRTGAPSSNADVAPTLLRLLGISGPRGQSSRVLEEILRDGEGQAVVHRSTRTSVLPISGDLEYRSTLFLSRVGGTTYVDSTRTTRGRRRGR